mmetsp:Transcript_12487/g.18716  ORF Transcript_12487/g.18716 Transcript_12487/m.18716 type:complete len:377 (-) Transcript_12487:226-1356(-)
MALSDTRSFANGQFSIAASPFKTSADFSVYDHIKYVAFSKQTFTVPPIGSVTFSAGIDVTTTCTQPGRIISGSYPKRPGNPPYAQPTREGQQAAAVVNMLDFHTGQLFNIFVSSHYVLALIERLPSSVSGSPLNVTLDKIYTQFVKEVPISPGKHKFDIKYTRLATTSTVQYFVDGVEFASVKDVGIPLDVQNAEYTGTYPSFGPGEKLINQINSFSIGHGLFSLLDAFPFQYPSAPAASFVSIPVANRIFGQGASAKFSNFTVSTTTFSPTSAPIAKPTAKPTTVAPSAPLKLCLFATGCFLKGVDMCQAGSVCNQLNGYSQCLEASTIPNGPTCTTMNNYGCQQPGGRNCCNPEASCVNGVCRLGACSYNGYYN